MRETEGKDFEIMSHYAWEREGVSEREREGEREAVGKKDISASWNTADKLD